MQDASLVCLTVCQWAEFQLMVEYSNASSVCTDELIQAGWSKCWSKRENRAYYFNRFTNQSLWEMPVLGQHDVIVSVKKKTRSRNRGMECVCKFLIQAVSCEPISQYNVFPWTQL